jgi:hypothetical protein
VKGVVSAVRNVYVISALRQKVPRNALIEEMSVALSTGLLDGEYETGPTEIMPTTLERFAATVSSLHMSQRFERHSDPTAPLEFIFGTRSQHVALRRGFTTRSMIELCRIRQRRSSCSPIM